VTDRPYGRHRADTDVKLIKWCTSVCNIGEVCKNGDRYSCHFILCIEGCSINNIRKVMSSLTPLVWTQMRSRLGSVKTQISGAFLCSRDKELNKGQLHFSFSSQPYGTPGVLLNWNTIGYFGDYADYSLNVYKSIT